MNIKVSVPWPYKKSSQKRIIESLDLWNDKNSLLICMTEDCEHKFLDQFDKVTLSRNSSDIGTKIPKCYIYDMMQEALRFDSEWVGFSNSDCVPVENLVKEEDLEFESLIFHRTDVSNWDILKVPKRLLEEIFKMEKDQISNKDICRRLNRLSAKHPDKWTEDYLKPMLSSNKKVFFWGQDMYLFKRNIVEKIMDEYLKIKDPILGTGGFDPRLSKWLVENTKAKRIINRIFHKTHTSEWSIDEIEYKHNGGDIDLLERISYFEDKFILELHEAEQSNVIPKYIKYLIGKNNPELHKLIS